MAEKQETGQDAQTLEVDTSTPNLGSDDSTMVPIDDLRKVRAEAAERRKENETLQAQITTIQQEQTEAKKAADRAKMDEVERAKAENADLQAQIVQLGAQNIATAKKAAIISAASAAGFNDPSDAAFSIPLDSINTGEGGAVDTAQIGTLVAQLAETKPYLIKQITTPVGGGFGATNPAPGSAPKAKITGSASDIAALQEQIVAAQAAGNFAEATKLTSALHGAGYTSRWANLGKEQED